MKRPALEVLNELRDPMFPHRAAALDDLASLLTEARDLHDHAIDQGVVDCDGIPGGCPMCAAIARVEGRA